MFSLIICPECEKKVGIPAGTHETAEVKCPGCEADFTLADLLPDDLEIVTIVDPGEGPVETPDASDSDIGFVPDDFDDAPAFSFDTADSAETAAVATDPATATEEKSGKKKKKRRKVGLIGNMVGIVVFGIVGLGLGYGALKWLAPEKAKPIDKWVMGTWDKVVAYVGPFISDESGETPPDEDIENSNNPDADNPKTKGNQKKNNSEDFVPGNMLA
ncbi:MAG: hypothetical protein N2C12_08935, partial [Planctomycetales bacterium]